MKNVAILLPGIIREYTYLEYINDIRKLENEGNFKFYFFGICYDFQGTDKTAWHTHLDIENDKKVDLRIVEKYNLDDLEVCTDIITEDADGYDGRILAQWTLVKEAFTMMENFSKKNQIQFDCVVRSRWDIKIFAEKLNTVIKCSVYDNKICCIKYVTVTDQSFIGPYDKMKVVCNLSEYYYDYVNLKKFKERTIIHKTAVGDILTNPTKYPRRVLRDRKNEFNIRFPAQSENLLTYHLSNKFTNKVDYINVTRKNKWWQLRKVKN